MTEICRRHPLLLFFVLAFFGFWGCIALNRVPKFHFWVPMLGVFAPAGAALVVTGFREGEGGIRRLVHRLGKWRVRPAWYLAAIGIPIAQACVALAMATTAHEFKGLDLGSLRAILPASWIFYLFAVGEELGWRGFALPRLLERHSPLVASVILGFLHSAWHWPLILLPHGLMSDLPLFPWTVAVISEALVFTWLIQGTDGSILMAVLWHGTVNTSMLLFNAIDSAWMPWIKSGLCVATSVVLVVLVGMDLGRKRTLAATASASL
jgi:membrane protease YdiL (CAAX protease family)